MEKCEGSSVVEEVDETSKGDSQTLASVGESHSRTDSMPSRVEIETYEEIAHSDVTWVDDWETVQKSCLSEIPPIDPEILVDLEVRAKNVAGNLDHMLTVLSNSLKAMSRASTQCLSSYTSCVDNVSDTVDANIKSMYTLIARCEELNASLKPVHSMAKQVKDIKKTLDVFEAVCK